MEGKSRNGGGATEVNAYFIEATLLSLLEINIPLPIQRNL